MVTTSKLEAFNGQNERVAGGVWKRHLVISKSIEATTAVHLPPDDRRLKEDLPEAVRCSQEWYGRGCGWAVMRAFGEMKQEKTLMKVCVLSLKSQSISIFIWTGIWLIAKASCNSNTNPSSFYTSKSTI